MKFIRSHPLIGLVDHNETYGRHVIRDFLRKVSPQTVIDVGAGPGTDLSTVHEIHPYARLIAVDFKSHPGIRDIAHEHHELDVERHSLPFADETIDLIISNQTLEHTKEVWWIFHEMTRTIKVGGHLIVGVPNIASLHSRVMLLIGMQPSQQKTCSAHVRSFSKGDVLSFLDMVWPGYELAAFGGSQFYPFPRAIARPLSSAFPTLSVCIFFLLKKTQPYHREFIEYPRKMGLETNFYVGD
jgi:SAM-dependent methyltransferase